ncbi:MAG TPA: AmmeMemoRadiSam system protein B [Longimicrobiales bacterium]|nr:AmmeMemoRadiSam system protein B [Longimicrobiales bacterium]
MRRAAVAGRFYPADPVKLETAVRGFVEASPPGKEPWPVALIAPHAGYAYSGPVAGSAYALVAPGRGRIQRVVVLGPSHHLAFRGLAAPGCEAFATPLGVHEVDAERMAALCVNPIVRRWQKPHRDEHSLEVHLPFIQVVLGPIPVLPLLTGEVGPGEVADVLDAVWTADTLVVASSDLSHYLPAEEARERDAWTATIIEGLHAGSLGPTRACGCQGVRGLLVWARRRGLVARCVDLRNSGDTGGPAGRVVGYGAFGFWRAEALDPELEEDG